VAMGHSPQNGVSGTRFLVARVAGHTVPHTSRLNLREGRCDRTPRGSLSCPSPSAHFANLPASLLWQPHDLSCLAFHESRNEFVILLESELIDADSQISRHG
jgi:hypothetical protein